MQPFAVAYLQNFTEADKNILASKRLRRIYLRAANQIHFGDSLPKYFYLYDAIIDK